MTDAFSQACGATGALCCDVRHEDDSTPTHWKFRQPFLLVGRNPAADLDLSDDQVGLQHCYLQMIGGRLFAVDLGAPGGVLFGGLPKRTAWIDREGELEIGPFSLRIFGPDGPGGPEPPSPLSTEYSRQNPLPSTTVEIASVGQKTHRWRMGPALALIGQSSLCKVRLLSPDVSPVHCAILRTPSGPWIVDLMSTQGTFIDGIRVRAARLGEGNKLAIGPFHVRVVGEAAARSRGSLCLPEKRHESSTAEQLQRPRREPLVDVNSSRPLPSLHTLVESQAPAPDQLRETMLMLAQMFGAMHRDHMDVVREELVQLRRLSEEIHSLRTDLLRAHADPAVTPALGGSRGLGEPRPTSPLQAASEPGQARTLIIPYGPQSSRMSDAAAATPSEAPRPEKTADGSELPSASLRSEDSSPRRDPWETHAIASEFLAAYQREVGRRNGRWEKILRTLLGQGQGTKSTGGPLGNLPQS